MKLKNLLTIRTRATKPANPDAGHATIYTDGTDLWVVNDAGTATKIGASTGGGTTGVVAVYDGGTPSSTYTGVAKIDFGSVT